VLAGVLVGVSVGVLAGVLVGVSVGVLAGVLRAKWPTIRYKIGLFVWDGGLLVAAIVLALLTGLGALYFGQPFGTAKDYCTAITWGITTKAALEALIAALDRFLKPG